MSIVKVWIPEFIFQMKHQAKFECKLCDKTFNEYDKMSKHVKHQHGQQLKREFTCKLCAKSFEYEKNLANHLKVHDKPRRTEFKCDQCDRVFNNKSTLCYHRQRHATPFLQCTICAKEVKTPKGLRFEIIIVHCCTGIIYFSHPLISLVLLMCHLTLSFLL